ncbi:MAG: arginase family protein, partial [Rubrobacteraceae bacterium]
AAETHGPVALVQFDSHADTWDAYFGKKYNHGTVFKRAVEEGLLRPEKSIQVGMRGSLYDAGDMQVSRDLGLELLTTDDVREAGIERTIDRIQERVGDAKVYVSFDVDFLDPVYAPGTGTPEVGGFTSYEAQKFVRGLRGLDVVGCDVVEVYPQYDGPGQVTSLLAANIAYEFLSLIAMRKAGTD